MKIEFNKIAKQIINNSQYNDNKSDKALLFDFGNTDFNYKGLEIESCGGGGRNKNSKGQTIYTYVVKPGDTLSEIAQKLCCTVDDLIEWNPKYLGKNGENTIIKEGKKLSYLRENSNNDNNVSKTNRATTRTSNKTNANNNSKKIPESSPLYIKRSDYDYSNSNYKSKEITKSIEKALKATSFKEKTTAEFFKRLAYIESRFDPTRNCGSFHGLYQMGKDVCRDLKIQMNWFFNSPVKQQQYFEEYLKKHQAAYIKDKDMIKFIGKTVTMNIAKYGEPPNYKTFKVTAAGLFAGSHLVGAGGLNKSLTNNVAVYDGNGMPAAYYMWVMRDIKSRELSELLY